MKSKLVEERRLWIVAEPVIRLRHAVLTFAASSISSGGRPSTIEVRSSGVAKTVCAEDISRTKAEQLSDDVKLVSRFGSILSPSRTSPLVSSDTWSMV